MYIDARVLEVRQGKAETHPVFDVSGRQTDIIVGNAQVEVVLRLDSSRKISSEIINAIMSGTVTITPKNYPPPSPPDTGEGKQESPYKDEVW